MITVSVPSKVHLLGEHSVVYGRPALLAAINKRISVSITSSKTKQIQGVHLYMRQIKRVLEIAYKGEKFFHGNPSGGDLAVVLEGGLLWFRKEFEFLKMFVRLPFMPHRNIKQFVLINSGKPAEATR